MTLAATEYGYTTLVIFGLPSISNFRYSLPSCAARRTGTRPTTEGKPPLERKTGPVLHLRAFGLRTATYTLVLGYIYTCHVRENKFSTHYHRIIPSSIKRG